MNYGTATTTLCLFVSLSLSLSLSPFFSPFYVSITARHNVYDLLIVAHADSPLRMDLSIAATRHSVHRNLVCFSIDPEFSPRVSAVASQCLGTYLFNLSFPFSLNLLFLNLTVSPKDWYWTKAIIGGLYVSRLLGSHLATAQKII